VPEAVLNGQKIVVRKRNKQLLDGAHLALSGGEFVALLGPNGAGKTTLLRALLGLQPLHTGDVALNGSAIATYTDRSRARLVSYLPQQRELAWPNLVPDVVALGRYAHGAGTGALSELDQVAVADAISVCDLGGLATRRVDTLSGGELARVQCARVIAAQTPLLIADEPTAGLDLRHQHRILKLFREYVDDGHGVLAVLHDINLAMSYADRIVWLDRGKVVGEHLPQEVDPAFVAQLYDVEVVEVSHGLSPYFMVTGR
jgi:iron complex transport system ATP-binding protein